MPLAQAEPVETAAPCLSSFTTQRCWQSASGISAAQVIDETLKLGKGTLLALDGEQRVTVHSTGRACSGCGRSFQPLDPKMFSYNSSQGWGPQCRGFGELFYMPDVERGARAARICVHSSKRKVRGSRFSTVHDVARLAVAGAAELFSGLKFTGREALIPPCAARTSSWISAPSPRPRTPVRGEGMGPLFPHYEFA